MVNVIFYNLLRSKYRISEINVQPGSINDIVDQIIASHPEMDRRDFESAVVFHHGKPIHFRQFNRIIDDKEEIIMTHFVGGG